VTDEERSNAARELSKAGAAKGGRARASTMTAEARQEQARRAVQARWAKAGKAMPEPETSHQDEAPAPTEPTVLYSMYHGTLHIGDVEIECHVLNDGRRVLSQREVVRVLTGGRDSGTLGRYLRRHPTFDESRLNGRTIQFRATQTMMATGYEGTLLIELCDAYLDARQQGVLRRGQGELARMAEIIIRACAKVGITALIDEATGYQEIRARNALQMKLQAFIADDLQEWAKKFPDEFWFELARLEGIHYSVRHRPLRWGRYVMMFVYDAMDEDVGKQLRSKNPNPRFLSNHHQWLKKFGQDKLQSQIAVTIAIMKLCNDMDDFRQKFARVFAKTRQLQLDDLDWTS